MAFARVVELLARGSAGESAAVRGWLRTARHSKGVSFLDLSDGSSLAGLQVVAGPELENYQAEVVRLDTGCAVEVEGELVPSQGSGQALELRATRLVVVGWADSDYPLQKKRHGFEFLRTIAHLRPRTNTFGAVLRVRNVAARAVHRFFQERGFVWLHTPIITASDAEGAGAMFRVAATEFDGEFFGRPAFLTVSGQLEAEIGALALSNVYTFGPTFRAENSNTSRHLAEFWMIEPEMAFCDLRGDMELAQAFLRYVVKAVLDESEDDLAFFDERISSGLRATLEHVALSSFEHLTYGEAVAILERSGQDFEFPVKWGADLASEHERFLTESHVGRPVIVTDYPKAIKAFYMYCNDDGQTVRAMDVLVPKVGEIIGGSQREDRVDVLRARLAECGLPEAPYQWYLDLRRFGSVPHAGFGLGFERLVLYLTGMANIRDVIPFPRVPGYAEF
ncbi:MAG: asparagine--tRNA ligase [Deltaproteobacteria bacterium]|nr:asparagine--tRNA ligase [Deltaproteobacteria bacterium]